MMTLRELVEVASRLPSGALIERIPGGRIRLSVPERSTRTRPGVRAKRPGARRR